MEQKLTPPHAQDETSSFRMVATLGVAGLIAGFLLVGIYIFTLPYIEANKAEALKRAIFQVLPGCTSYTALELQDGKLVKSRDKKSKKPKIFVGYDSEKKLVGFAIPAEEPGFQDLIKGILGYRADKKTIIGFQVLESVETPGLGDKITSDAQFAKNFQALSVEPEILPVKIGKKTKPNELETITGATISSKAVVRLLNKAIGHWKAPIEDYLKNKKKRGK